MAESGLGGRFWFGAATAGKDARNVTFKERIGMTPYQVMYGEKKDVSNFRAFRCRAWVYLDMSKPEFSRGKSKTFQPFNRAFSALYNALQLHSECAELKRD